MAKITKTMDLSKFRKSITKSIDGISVGFRDPTVWVDTGNYALNYLISDDFFKGIPLSKTTILAGKSGSAKSYLASANLIKNAQAQGIMCVLVDTENAIDEDWLKKLGVDTSEDKLLKVNIALINDAGSFISMFVNGYKEQYKDVPESERPGVLFVIDSLGMLSDPVAQDQFSSGNLSKGTFGTKAKATKALITQCVNLIADWNIGLVCTQHTASSQDPYSPDDLILGGDGQIFAASIVVAMRKGKLKEDENGAKITEVTGIRSICTVFKSRFNHKALYKKVEIKIPFESGMEPTSGLFEFFLDEKMLTKEGNRYSYSGKSGNFLEFRKNISNEQFAMLMNDYPAFAEEHNKAVAAAEIEAPEDDE
jgi:RecA/RadA recombinase